MFHHLLVPLVVSLAVAAPVEERNASPCSTGISAASSTAVQSAFTSSGVVPTLIPAIDPKVAVNVVYPDGKQVNLGNKFLTAETLTMPNLTFDAEPGYDPKTTKYSYFLVDPDVPGPNGVGGVQIRVNYLHWEVANAQPACGEAQSPETVAIYQPLTPASTDQHRYTFLVYRQPVGYSPDLITPQTRAAFDLTGYTSKGGLTLVGGNFLREAITNT